MYTLSADGRAPAGWFLQLLLQHNSVLYFFEKIRESQECLKVQGTQSDPDEIISSNYQQEKQQQQEQKTTNAHVFDHIRGIRAPL